MNVIISALVLKFFFEYLNSIRIDVTMRIKVITYFGLLSPLSDYIIRYINAKPLTQNSPIFFQSFVYQILFWSFIVFFNWVIFRDLKRSIRYYSPVLGLTIYSLFTIFSTSKTPFLYPILKRSISFNLVNSGYLLPLGILILLWIFKKVLTRKTKLVNWAALTFLALFIIFTMGTMGAIKSTLPEPFNKSEKVDIRPANHFHTKWMVISDFQGKYYLATYQVLKGWEKEIQNRIKYQDIDLVQNLLMNPKIRSLYFNVFNNPILNIEIQRENLYLEMFEPAPSFDLFWSNSAKIVLNNSGQIKTFQIRYKFLNWNALTMNI
jgi:hypothetical protein